MFKAIGPWLFRSLISLYLLTGSLALAKPGAEAILEEKTLTATLYLTEIHRQLWTNGENFKILKLLKE